MAALGNVVGMVLLDGAGTGDMGVRDFSLLQLIGVLQGFAFGMLLRNTAAAIVLYYVVPIAWSVLFTMVGALGDVAPWLDLNTAMAPALEGVLPLVTLRYGVFPPEIWGWKTS